MSKIHVTTTINGDPQEFLCEPDETLLSVLRDRLGMTGSLCRGALMGLRRAPSASSNI